MALPRVPELLAVLGGTTVLGPWGFATAAPLRALGAAWLSWHLVEKPLPGLKRAVG